jgi:polyketide synthase 5
LKRLRAEVADVPHSVRPEERQITVANHDPDRMRLQIRTPGALELVACDRLRPGLGQIELAVNASSINFADVLVAFGR